MQTKYPNTVELHVFGDHALFSDPITRVGGEHFPKAGETIPGEWCENGFSVNCEDGKVEIGVYREPKDNKEYSGTLTLQIYNGDDVIFCSKILEE